MDECDSETVEIVLSVYNGETYLKQQIDSLLKQSHHPIRIICRDDGSKDSSSELLLSYQEAYPENFELFNSGENQGIVRSFFGLLGHTTANYVMFCDQDDIWLENKVRDTLARVKNLELENGAIKPCLVYTDMSVVDSSLQEINHSFWAQQKINPQRNKFNQLLVENIVTGCTVMMNRSLVNLIRFDEGVLMHDWWVALIAAAFGVIEPLEQQTILYRQHEKNSVGALSQDLMSRISRLSKVVDWKDFRSEFEAKQNQATVFLDLYADSLGSAEKELLREFSSLHLKKFLEKRLLITKYGFFPVGILRSIAHLIRL